MCFCGYARVRCACWWIPRCRPGLRRVLSGAYAPRYCGAPPARRVLMVPWLLLFVLRVEVRAWHPPWSLLAAGLPLCRTCGGGARVVGRPASRRRCITTVHHHWHCGRTAVRLQGHPFAHVRSRSVQMRTRHLVFAWCVSAPGGGPTEYACPSARPPACLIALIRVLIDRCVPGGPAHAVRPSLSLLFQSRSGASRVHVAMGGVGWRWSRACVGVPALLAMCVRPPPPPCGGPIVWQRLAFLSLVVCACCVGCLVRRLLLGSLSCVWLWAPPAAARLFML